MILEGVSPLSYLSLPREYPVLRVFKRGISPSFQNLPPLLDKERGTQVEDSSRGEVNKQYLSEQGTGLTLIAKVS